MNELDRSVEKYEYLNISRRLVSLVFAVAIFTVFVSFMIGYFLGIKHTTDEFVVQIRHETLANQFLVSSTMQTQSLDDNQNLVEVKSDSTACVPSMKTTEQNNSALVLNAELLSTSTANSDTLLSYSAELIGFGTQYAAQEFINRVKLYSSLKLALKERSSKTPRGKLITWYQVTTEKYEQKNELQAILDILINKEHLHDVKIVAHSATKRDLI